MMATRADVLAPEARLGERILRRHERFRLLPFLGPAFVACVAYIDPGNFATNIAGGSKFGYTLVWVIVLSNLMAMLIQTLSAKLGIATGRNLPEVCRDGFPHRVSIGLWVQAEVIAMATDLAEFLGAAIGFHLLLGIGLFPAALMTGAATFLILGLQRYGFRLFEAVITAFVAVILACYVAELWFAHPSWSQVGRHAVVPQFQGQESLLLAVGILGATVMPHVIYLHSALTQRRIVPQDDAEARRLYRYTRIDVVIAMSIAGLINMSMLIVAASVFFDSGLLNVESLEGAHRTLEPLLGGASSALFAIALIASGLSSSTVGTLAGQVVMQGFIRRSIPVTVRRLVTMLPALIVIALGPDGLNIVPSLDPSRTLVISQVVLSFGIPFALIPLVWFTSRRDVMGKLVNHRVTTAVAVVVAAGISALNLFLLAQTVGIA
jgi:manganese transport protein